MHACLYRELTELKVVDTMYDEIWAALACLLAVGWDRSCLMSDLRRKRRRGLFHIFEVTHGR